MILRDITFRVNRESKILIIHNYRSVLFWISKVLISLNKKSITEKKIFLVWVVVFHTNLFLITFEFQWKQ